MSREKVAWIFPGQGSQYVGMGTKWLDSPIGREHIEKLHASVGPEVSSVLMGDDAEKLKQTTFAQPSILTVSSVMIRELLQAGAPPPTITAGHSLGEYSALVLATRLSYSRAVDIVHQRGMAMQKAVPLGYGGMSAVLATPYHTVEDLLRDKPRDVCLEMANDNSQAQIILAGCKSGLAWLQANAKKYGLKKVIPLPVSAPFHSSMMEPVKEPLSKAIGDSVNLRPPMQVKVVHNLTATPVEPMHIKQSLISQLTARVRWRETMDYLIEQNVTRVLEVGPGDVLTRIFKKHNKNIECRSLDKWDNWRAEIRNYCRV